jgi:hypothetical protein
VRVKARDVFGLESVWSDPLSITMPKNKPYVMKLLMQLSEKYENLFQLLNNLFNIQ